MEKDLPDASCHYAVSQLAEHPVQNNLFFSFPFFEYSFWLMEPIQVTLHFLDHQGRLTALPPGGGTCWPFTSPHSRRTTEAYHQMTLIHKKKRESFVLVQPSSPPRTRDGRKNTSAMRDFSTRM